MAVVRPLEALRYDPARAGDVGSLLAPPYDVITPSEQAELHARSPYNVIRLILSQEADRAAAAARTLRDWVERGILVRDRTPAVYLYSQRFSLPDGTTRRRDGVLCRLRLEEYGKGIVRRHERTLAAPKVPLILPPADAYGQAKRCLEIIAAALREAGAETEHVVRTRTFLLDVEDSDDVGRAHGEMFGDVRPASTMIVVAGLLDPRWLVEIEADALLPA